MNAEPEMLKLAAGIANADWSMARKAMLALDRLLGPQDAARRFGTAAERALDAVADRVEDGDFELVDTRTAAAMAASLSEGRPDLHAELRDLCVRLATSLAGSDRFAELALSTNPSERVDERHAAGFVHNLSAALALSRMLDELGAGLGGDEAKAFFSGISEALDLDAGQATPHGALMLDSAKRSYEMEPEFFDWLRAKRDATELGSSTPAGQPRARKPAL